MPGSSLTPTVSSSMPRRARAESQCDRLILHCCLQVGYPLKANPRSRSLHLPFIWEKIPSHGNRTRREHIPHLSRWLLAEMLQPDIEATIDQLWVHRKGDDTRSHMALTSESKRYLLHPASSATRHPTLSQDRENSLQMNPSPHFLCPHPNPAQTACIL